MLTSNFMKYLYSCSYYGGTRGYRDVSVKDLTGDTVIMPPGGEDNQFLRKFLGADSTSEVYPFWLMLGSGNTTPTIDDYILENEIASVTPLAGDYMYNAGNNKIRIYRAFANNTDSAIEISEVGLATRVTTTSGSRKILLAREVSASPITIEPNGIQTFGIDIG